MHQSTTSTRQHPKQKSRAYTFRPSTLREPTRSTWGPGERVLNSPGFPAVTFSQRKQGWKLMKPQLALMASRDSSRERERELHPRYETHYTHTELRWFFNKNEGINFTKFSNPIPIKKEKERGKKVSLHGGETRSVFIRMLFRRLYTEVIELLSWFWTWSNLVYTDEHSCYIHSSSLYLYVESVWIIISSLDLEKLCPR